MSSLAEALPEEINRVRQIQDELKQLRGMPNVIVGPQIMLMEASIQNAIKVSATGDIIGMLQAYEDLKGYGS